MNNHFLCTILLVIFLFEFNIGAQTKDQIKSQAESQLQQMTPDQIDAKIKEYGMTREQAEIRAQSLGIDLSTYIQRRGIYASPNPMLRTNDFTPLPQSLIKSDSLSFLTPPDSLKGSRPGRFFDSTIIANGLPYFGYEIFLIVPDGFEPLASGPVDPEYLIGSDDIIRVTMWGQAEFQSELIVDKEGRIIIPTIGPVIVSGLTLEQSYQKLLKQFSRSYSGLTGQPPTVWLDISLSRLRPKRIFLAGEVRNPGGYTVNSYASVFNTLFGVGGPTIKGSLREVRVLRGNKIIAKVDLYDYLTGADKNNDIRVQNNDIIFVPMRGKTVAVKGEVNKPAIYELLPKENIKRILEIAGIKSTTYTDRALVKRIKPAKQRKKGEYERTTVDVNLREVLLNNKDFELVDGDTIEIFSIFPNEYDFISLRGAVRRPGEYQIEKNVTKLRDVILAADSILPETHRSRADIFRMRPDSTYLAITVDLELALKGDAKNNILLEPLDSIRIYSNNEINVRRFVSIRGHIKFPGVRPYADSLTLYDLIFQAGGLNDSVYRAETFLERADIFRLNPDKITKQTIAFNLRDLLNGDSKVNQLLQPDDEVVIYEIEVSKLRNKFIEVFGEVRRPGRFELTSNMKLTGAILLAGGFTENANTLQAEIARVEPRGMGEDSLSYIRFSTLPDLFDSLKVKEFATDGYRSADFPLQHRDKIFIRPNPEYKVQENIIARGEVKYPGQYSLRKRNETLSDVIERAGGVNKSAYLKGTIVTRNGIRVITDAEYAVINKDRDYDIILQPNDDIFIPVKPNSVFVRGEVNNPGIFGFLEGDNTFDYIDRAGGLTDSALFIVVTFPTGESKQVGSGWFSSNPEVLDGSTISVSKIPPPDPEEKRDYFSLFKDIFAVAASVVTVLVLARQI